MKKTILVSTALLLCGTAFAFAAAPHVDVQELLLKADGGLPLQLADNDGGDDHGGGNAGGNTGGGNDDHDDGDDHDNDDNDDDHDDDHVNAQNNAPAAGGEAVHHKNHKKKKRVPGGTGCDDAGDVAEHPECATQN